MSDTLETGGSPRVKANLGAALRGRWQKVRGGLENFAKTIASSYAKFVNKTPP